jgi:hypothetical protein
MKIPIVDWASRKASRALDFSKIDVAALKKGRDAAFARARDHSPPITAVMPVARAIPLGGRRRVAHELRISDLAELQAWLEEQVPHPLASIPPAWADPDPGTRTARLAEAWEAAASWPVRFGTARAGELLASAAGRAFFLWLCLRRGSPSFGVVDALALLAEVTPTEWAGLRRVAYGLTPRQEIADELAPDESPGRMSNWCLSFHRAVMSDAGITYSSIGELTLSQWRNFCNEGKPAEQSAEFAARAKRAGEVLGRS